MSSKRARNLIESAFIYRAEAAGFTPDMAEFLRTTFSRKPHTHTADQIEDLDEAVTDIVDDLED